MYNLPALKVMYRSLLQAFILFLMAPGLAPTQAAQGRYAAGLTQMKEIGHDMYLRLAPHQRRGVSANPISYDTSKRPFVKVMRQAQSAGVEPINGVWVSAGFIDLANQLAHAKAIDRVARRGYFKEYIEQLAAESGTSALQPLKDINTPSYWSDRVMNEQESNFNSIVSMILGVKLAHHYLGQYQKYEPSIISESASINGLLTRSEWDQAFEAGVMSALQAGCTIEGIVPFFEAFGKMKERPQWAGFFLPQHTKVTALIKQAKKVQREFFDE